ncbi:eukaryotic translation initiation factor 2D-like [Tubulanus polymorphus]|uniref:eukaryotic translation initiation factor 2D-like n=1 Tax=Tubulanus polymorphus TaxID=672921 RepID=UPI003DA47599
MFTKPFKIKTQTAIRGSDRKKLRNDVAKFFSGIPSDIVPGNKEEMTIMKIYTHAGENVTVYCLHRNPIFFETKDHLYPTVYTMWKYPGILPVFTTWPPVIKKLQAGADLMLPGVIIKGARDANCLGKIDKGQLYAVNLADNRAPIGVGLTAMSSEDMYMSAMKGKGVLMAHVYKDYLWALGDKSEPPDMGISDVIVGDLNLEDDDNLAVETVNDPLSMYENGQILTDVTDDHSQNTDNMVGNLAAAVDEIEVKNHLCVSELQTQPNGDGSLENLEDITARENEEEISIDPQVEMDNLLYQCLLHAIKEKINIKRGDLPILMSTFSSQHMKSCCPAGKTLDIKKSSYKKFSKFMHEMQKKDLILVKELSKGVESIIDVNKLHPDVRSFVIPDIPESVEEEPDEESYSPPEIVEMFSVNGATLPFFKNMGFQKGLSLSASEIRKTVTDYVKSNELQDQNNRSQVILDGVLSDLVLYRGEQVSHVKWDDLFHRLSSKMGPMHLITFPGQKPQLHKGKPEPVKASISQRGGNKKVSLIENLEPYGIDPQKFAHDIQISLACSTSVSPLPGKNRGQQVLIQGNQLAHILQLLKGKYQLKDKYLSGFEKAIKPKKGAR